ncbi:unnamed protein product [Polarella glacialis]|uniref:Carbohydrate kinase PfkB domain-containing protein n=1 Tax=Polarella glacialis TaxID=89957 RepID=A0A813I1T9_POLGL|nr:unnamed protein product [Polarella glacialis]
MCTANLLLVFCCSRMCFYMLNIAACSRFADADGPISAGPGASEPLSARFVCFGEALIRYTPASASGSCSPQRPPPKPDVEVWEQVVAGAELNVASALAKLGWSKLEFVSVVPRGPLGDHLVSLLEEALGSNARTLVLQRPDGEVGSVHVWPKTGKKVYQREYSAFSNLDASSFGEVTLELTPRREFGGYLELWTFRCILPADGPALLLVAKLQEASSLACFGSGEVISTLETAVRHRPQCSEGMAGQSLADLGLHVPVPVSTMRCPFTMQELCELKFLGLRFRCQKSTMQVSLIFSGVPAKRAGLLFSARSSRSFSAFAKDLPRFFLHLSPLQITSWPCICLNPATFMLCTADFQSDCIVVDCRIIILCRRSTRCQRGPLWTRGRRMALLQPFASGTWSGSKMQRQIIDPLNGEKFLSIPDTSSEEAKVFAKNMKNVPKSGLHNPLKNPERYRLYGDVAALMAQAIRDPAVEALPCCRCCCCCFCCWCCWCWCCCC